jgi:hypothetical protein
MDQGLILPAGFLGLVCLAAGGVLAVSGTTEGRSIGPASSAEQLPVDDDPGHDWDLVERHEDSGRLRLRGRFDQQGRSSGEWKAWYPDGQRRWQGHYVAGEWDRARPWVSYAPDGTVVERGGDAESQVGTTTGPAGAW